MIHADRKHLEATLRADTIGIRDKEFSYLLPTSLCWQRSLLFLPGLACGLTMVPVWYSNLSGTENIQR